jgi:hypothetical protein
VIKNLQTSIPLLKILVMGEFEIFTNEQIYKDGKKLYMKINTPIQEVNRIITDIRAEVVKDEADFEVLKRLCFHLIERLPLPLHYYSNSFIIRARENKNGEIFSEATQMGYNKTCPQVTELARFNLEGKPVFYGAIPISSDKADGTMTAITETCKDLINNKCTDFNKRFTVGKFVVKKPISVIMLTFYVEAWQKSIHIQNINPAYTEFVDKTFEPASQEVCATFYKFFSECAGKRNDSPNNYKLTTAFFHAIQQYYGEEVGIIYSSSVTDNYGLNIVLTQKVQDENYLQLTDIVMYKSIRNQSEKQHKLFPYCKGFNNNGNFTFSNIEEEQIPINFFSFPDTVHLMKKYFPEIRGRKITINEMTSDIVGLRPQITIQGFQIIAILASGVEERLEVVLSLLYLHDDTYFDKYNNPK